MKTITIKTSILKDVMKKCNNCVKYAKNSSTWVNKDYFLIRCINGMVIATVCADSDSMLDIKLDYEACDFDLSHDHFLFLLPLKRVNNLCKKIDVDEIVVSVDRDGVFIHFNTTKLKYSIENTDMFCILNTGKCKNKMLVKFNGKTLLDAINSCAFAMGVDDSRTFCNGMLFRVEKDVLTLVATDACRLAHTAIKHESKDHEINTDYIIPRDTILLLQKLISKDDEIGISIYGNDNKDIIKIECSNWGFYTDLIDTTYADYSRVIPVNNKQTIKINTKDLKRLIEKVSIIGFNKYNEIKLRYVANTQLLTAKVINSDSDEILDQINVIATSESLPYINFRLNYKYLLEFTKNYAYDDFLFSWSDVGIECESSLLITSEQDTHYKYVVMPLRNH